MEYNQSGASTVPPKSRREILRKDLISGFLVFLIALPLCLGIALASGFPAIAGVFTAIIGGIVTTFISNSELTIKGPAAGLIVIVLGCVTDFGFTGGRDLVADLQAYRLTLGVGAVAGVIQIVFGLFKVGILGEIFPLAAVHGMLAAIGVIIFAKQFPLVLGAASKGGNPLQMLAQIPSYLEKMNPDIAFIGILSVILLFSLPKVRNRYLKMIPGPMLVLLFAVPLGVFINLSHEHTYTLMARQFKVGENYLVNVPGSLFRAVTFPDFSGLRTLRAWKWVAMFALIGSLESLLSAKAVDLLDPRKRKTDLDKDLLAVGVGNVLAAFVGGLPMISEIVRSRANIDNGAEGRYSNFFHGLFLFWAVLFLPHLIHRIPLAALAAMLVYTGYRLASPKEFVQIYKVGKEQFVVFTSTLVAVLATDLLVGILIGIAVEILIHVINGAPLGSVFVPRVKSEADGEGRIVITPESTAVFTNWLRIKGCIQREGLDQNRHVIIDLSRTRLVDHTVMEKLHQLQNDFSGRALTLLVRGLDAHTSLSAHPLAAKKRARFPITA